LYHGDRKAQNQRLPHTQPSKCQSIIFPVRENIHSIKDTSAPSFSNPNCIPSLKLLDGKTRGSSSREIWQLTTKSSERKQATQLQVSKPPQFIVFKLVTE
jgi:hypothetical protein